MSQKTTHAYTERRIEKRGVELEKRNCSLFCVYTAIPFCFGFFPRGLSLSLSLSFCADDVNSITLTINNIILRYVMSTCELTNEQLRTTRVEKSRTGIGTDE